MTYIFEYSKTPILWFSIMYLYELKNRSSFFLLLRIRMFFFFEKQTKNQNAFWVLIFDIAFKCFEKQPEEEIVQLLHHEIEWSRFGQKE